MLTENIFIFLIISALFVIAWVAITNKVFFLLLIVILNKLYNFNKEKIESLENKIKKIRKK